MNSIAALVGLIVFFVSCNSASKSPENRVDTTDRSVDAQRTPTQEVPMDTKFNLADIPSSRADIGDFPFISLPKDLKEMNKPLLRAFDVCFFPIAGQMTPFEGKLYKTSVSAVPGTDFSQHFFEKSMAAYLESLAAVNIFDGEITREEYDRYHKQDPNKGGEGDIGYAGQHIKFWVLRTADKGNIYIQYQSNNAGASLNVLQETAFEQSITKITAEDITKDLNEKGKSIVYINFDVAQSTLTAAGEETVVQIAAALQQDQLLKISIEGHTDNSGDAAQNVTLSKDRAQAVLNSLTAQGIAKTRLAATGYGAQQPLVANDAEAQKAQNRRVELIRIH